MKDENDLLPHLDGYISVRDTAEFLGVAESTVYGYVDAGRLPALRVGGGVAVEEQAVKSFKPQETGRPRTRIPIWRLPVRKNIQYLMNLSAHIKPGQQENFSKKLKEIQRGKKHLLPGTVARYVALGEENPDTVQVVLIWRSTVMPAKEEREAALNALREDFAGIVDWTVVRNEYNQVVMNT